MTYLSETAEAILTKRYYLKDKEGKVLESWPDLVYRVARAIDGGQGYADEYAGLIERLEFLPNSPTLMNAGTGMGTLSACFVLPIEDTMEGIMDAAKDQAMVQKFGGGTGFSLSSLRPKADSIATTHGVACGPVAVLKHLSSVSRLVTQGGKRDGANMAVMSVHHPDIMEFISCKSTEGDIHNFNISVGITDKFMRALISRGTVELVNPRNGTVVQEVEASTIWKAIVNGAHKNGEPGVIFLDQANREHRAMQLPEITATNPCGEQPLLGNESCNLGSLAVNRFVEGGTFDWVRLGAAVRLAVRFLDNVIDRNVYATQAIERATKKTRKIGLGVMGFADALIELGVRYDTLEARKIGSQLMQFIRNTADAESRSLLVEARNEGQWHYSWQDRKNACTTTIAPTGTISMIAGVSSGIEPIFATKFTKQNVLDGASFEYVHPKADSPVMVTAPEVPYDAHVKMQAAFQEYCDSGVSKTINLHHGASVAQVADAYLLAWQLGCKGLTVYRDGSREKEVLTSKPDINAVINTMMGGLTHATEECNGPVVREEGCLKCHGCGVSAC